MCMRVCSCTVLSVCERVNVNVNVIVESGDGS